MGVSFPDDYRRFLLKYNGGKPVKDRIQWTGRSGKLTGTLIDWFLTGNADRIKGLELYFHRYRGRMPSNLIPVAFDPGGNIICLACSGEDQGSVYFWDHESEALVVGHDQPYRENLRLISRSFDGFVALLTEYPRG